MYTLLLLRVTFLFYLFFQKSRHINVPSSLTHTHTHTHTHTQFVHVLQQGTENLSYSKQCWLLWPAAGGTLISFDIIKGHVKSI